MKTEQWSFAKYPDCKTWTVFGRETVASRVPCEEYARLIAAAPDLLEACNYVVKYHREHDSGEGELFGLNFVTTCIAAIAKATGGE